MKLNWRQAITSALVAGAIGAVLTVLMHGSISGGNWPVVVTVALTLGGARLTETKKS